MVLVARFMSKTYSVYSILGIKGLGTGNWGDRGKAKQIDLKGLGAVA